MATDRLTFVLPLPPGLNEMLDLAKQRASVRGRSIPVVYANTKRAYEMRCMVAARQAGIFPPREPWQRWRIVAVESRRHNALDLLESAASCKWVADFLVKERYVADDSPRHLVGPLPDFTHVTCRDTALQGVTLTIERVP